MQVALFNNQTNNTQRRNLQSLQSKIPSNTPRFSGKGNGFWDGIAKPLQALDANPILGVIVLDILTAIAPNTIIDTFKRNAAQGFETFRRESSGLIINCLLPGAFVIGFAFAMKKKILGEEFNHLPAHKAWANKASIDEGVSTWKQVSGIKDKKERITAFIEKSFEGVQCDEKSLMNIGTDAEKQQALKAKKEALDELVKEIINPTPQKEEGFKKWMKSVKEAIPGYGATSADMNSKKFNEIHDKLSKAYGSSKNVVIKKSEKEFISTNMKNHIRNTFAFANIFDDKAVNSANIDDLSKRMKKLVGGKTLLTMLSVGVLALSMQAINRAITEKSTGRKGYSGYKNLEGGDVQTAEDKAKLGLQKLGSIAWFSTLGFLSMGKFVGVPGKFDFSAPRTTVDQARILSLATDVGRVGAADEKTELQDTTVRDTIIFFNLYMAGDYINKAVLEGYQAFHLKKHGVDLNLFNKPAEEKTIFKKIGAWVKGKSIKSFEEIEGTAVKITEAAKNVDLANINQYRKNAVTASNLAGLLYSLGALGIAAPILIARMTNKNREKELAEAQKRKAASTSSVQTKAKAKVSNR